MPEISLDFSQEKAVKETDNHLYVTASAGTGKTEVLTRRYLHILEQKKATVNNILAITFTDKATNEMKKRILHFIVGKIKSENNDSQSYWRKVKNDFRHANISTIHSFCSKLIREHAAELEIDPDFDIIEETELLFEINKWIKKKLLSWLEDHDRANNVGDQAKPLLKQYTYPELKEILSELFFQKYEFEKKVIPLYERFNNENDYLDHLKNVFDKEKSERMNRLSKSQSFNTLFDTINSIDISCDKKKKAPFTKYLELVQEILSSLKEGQFHSQIAKLLSPYNKGKKLGKYDTEIWGETKIITIDKKLSALRYWMPQVLFEEISFDLDRKSYSITKSLISLYQDLISSIQSSPNTTPILFQWLNHSLLTYDDLQTLALELLSKPAHSQNRSHHYLHEQIRQKFRYIMVDECQDIDTIQKEIISSLTNLEHNTPNLFIVGDAKQSIYKFRGANISDFQALTKKIDKENKGNHSLNTNYRSQKGLVDFVNSLFTNLMGEQVEDFEVTYPTPIEAYRKPAFSSGVELLLHNVDRKKDYEDLKKEAQNIAKRILSLVEDAHEEKKVQYGDIAILFRTLTDFNNYEKALVEHSVPFQVVNSRGFYQLQEIVDCLNLLKILENHSDDLSLCGVLRSPFCGVSDQTLYWLKHYDNNSSSYFLKGFINSHDNQYLSHKEKEKLIYFKNILELLRSKKDRLKINDLLRLSLESTAYIPTILSQKYGEQKKTHIDYFLTKIKNLEKHKSWTLTAFLQYIDLLNQSNQSEEKNPFINNSNQVSIMTIHKAKGAEFPVVIIPNIDRKLPNNSPSFLLHPDFGIGLKVYSTDKRGLEKTFVYNYLQNIESRKDIAESKRLFYVAITRAKDYLIFSGKSKINSKHSIYDHDTTWLEYLVEASGTENSSLKDCLLTLPKDSNQELHDTVHFGRIPILVKWNIEKEIQSYTQEHPTKRSFNPDRSAKLMQNNDINHLEILTPTALLVYEKCPRKFFYKSVQKIKELIYPHSNKQNNNLASEELKATGCRHPAQDRMSESWEKWPKDIPLNLVGNLVHNILDKYKKSHHDLAYIISEHLNSEKLSALAQPTDREKVKTRIQEMLDRFINSELYNDIVQGENHFPEDHFNELSFIYKIGSTQLQGSIDKIYRDEKGHLTLLDYKTNRFQNRKNVQKELHKKNEEYIDQMKIYWLAASQFLNKGDRTLSSSAGQDVRELGIDKVKLYFFDIEKEIDSFTTENILNTQVQDHLNHMIKEINEKLNPSDSIQQLNQFNTKPSKDCHFCGYWMCEKK